MERDTRPLVSVIVPAYNAEKYVERCVDALLNQTYDNLEIILVDDGSKDKTYELCQKMQLKSDKIKAYTKTNGGAAAARNYGLSMSSGEYIAFMDVDDWVLEDYILYLYELLQSKDADVSMCDCYKMDVREKVPSHFEMGEERLLDRKGAMESLFYRTGVTAYPVLKLWKASVIAGGKFPEDMLYGEDFIYVYEMLKHCERVAYGKKVAYIYYQNAGSINRNVNYKQLVHSWKIFSRALPEDVKRVYPELLQATLSKSYILAIDFYNRIVKHGDPEGLRVELKRYIKKHGKHVYKDRRCKASNRILGVLGYCSPMLLLFLCRRFYDLKRVFRFEVRQSV